jgi:GT2 family glycosyltransferase
MRFSIVTTCRNAAYFLPDCLASVAEQKGVEVEHIVTDAASSDGTVELLKKHPEIQWTSEPDKGMSDGINKGFRRATGDWVMWLNADDYLLPGALEKVAKFAAEHPEADVIYGGWNFVDAEKHVLKTIKLFPVDRRMLVYAGCYIGSTACFFRRSTVIAEGHLLREDFHQVMDLEYYLRLLYAGKRFHHMPDVLAAFRIHGKNSSMRSMNDKSLDGVLRQQLLWAEGHALRRYYGTTWMKNEIYEGVVFAIFWTYFRIKKVMLKLWHGCYR